MTRVLHPVSGGQSLVDDYLAQEGRVVVAPLLGGPSAVVLHPVQSTIVPVRVRGTGVHEVVAVMPGVSPRLPFVSSLHNPGLLLPLLVVVVLRSLSDEAHFVRRRNPPAERRGGVIVNVDPTAFHSGQSHRCERGKEGPVQPDVQIRERSPVRRPVVSVPHVADGSSAQLDETSGKLPTRRAERVWTVISIPQCEEGEVRSRERR